MGSYGKQTSFQNPFISGKVYLKVKLKKERNEEVVGKEEATPWLDHLVRNYYTGRIYYKDALVFIMFNYQSFAQIFCSTLPRYTSSQPRQAIPESILGKLSNLRLA